MAASGFRLLVQQGPRAGQVYELDRPSIVIGREIGSDIVIEDPQVSRHHARLLLQGGGFIVEDLGSTNGTFINGRRVMGPTPLNLGDRLGLGDTVLLEMQGSAIETMVGRGQPQPDIMPPPPPPPGYEAPPPAYGAPPPPPATRSRPSCWIWGCGCLMVLCVALALVAAWVYFFAPPSITVPILDLLREFGIELF